MKAQIDNQPEGYRIIITGPGKVHDGSGGHAETVIYGPLTWAEVREFVIWTNGYFQIEDGLRYLKPRPDSSPAVTPEAPLGVLGNAYATRWAIHAVEQRRRRS